MSREIESTRGRRSGGCQHSAARQRDVVRATATAQLHGANTHRQFRRAAQSPDSEWGGTSCVQASRPSRAPSTFYSCPPQQSGQAAPPRPPRWWRRVASWSDRCAACSTRRRRSRTNAPAAMSTEPPVPWETRRCSTEQHRAGSVAYRVQSLAVSVALATTSASSRGATEHRSGRSASASDAANRRSCSSSASPPLPAAPRRQYLPKAASSQVRRLCSSTPVALQLEIEMSTIRRRLV